MKPAFFSKDGTAQGVAKQRMIESLAEPARRVIFDPYAERFVVGAGLIKLMGHKLSVFITQKFAPGFHHHLIARTRFIDELVLKAAADSVEQYVILGAGYDLRAHRLGLPSALAVFEVDQLEVQQNKRAKLPKALANADNVHYVSVDFNQQSLAQQLLAAGFKPNKSSIFTLEGVSQYVSKQALAETLKTLAELCHKNSATFFISYVDQRFKDEPEACFGKAYPNALKRAAMIQHLAAKVGEPWQSFYSGDEIKTLLFEYGFSVCEDTNLEELNDVYFAPLGRKLNENHILKLENFVVAKLEC